MPTVLVVDDDALIRERLRADLSLYDVLEAESAADALQLVATHDIDAMLLDILLPDASGFDVFRRLRETRPRLPVIFVTFHEESESVITAMKVGAFDYLVKPLHTDEVRRVTAKAIEAHRAMGTPVELCDGVESESRDVLIGRCPAMREVYKAIGRVAPSDVTVLIHGESGTGKELVARAIYQHSRRGDKPFLAVNCAALPESLLESTLFGHERGAFTGAERRQIGKFEQCSEGTLFLDEVGELSPAAQGKLLRVLEQQTFERLGGAETVRTNVRLLAATHRDLARDVAAGRFRQDLYFRLAVYTIELPPLRERTAELPLLLRHFLSRFSRELGKPITGLAPDVFDRLASYSWPGNVRELQGVLQQAMLSCSGTVLGIEHLPATLRSPPEPTAPARLATTGWSDFVQQRLAAGSKRLLSEAQSQMERELFAAVLDYTGGNKLQTAALLGITRGTLRRKLQELGLHIDHLVRRVEPEA